MDIERIRTQVRAGEYLWTLHADEERRNDGLEMADVETALLEGKILENYPQDPRGPSCLVYGESQGIPIHIVCGSNKAGVLVVITVYKPSPPKWRKPAERG